MKKVLLSLMLIACSALVSAVSLAQNSFSYQSVIRNNGEVVSNQDVALLISILSGSDVCYQEVQKVKTNAYGNISISVGEGEPKTGSFAAIPWETMQIMMQIEVSTDGTENYVNLGQMQIQPVPYTMYAARTTTVIQPKEASEDPIFEVRDSEGNLMFAVYETGVKVFVDQEGSKAAKSKFAVAGRSVSKDDEDLLTIDAAGTTVYVDDNEDDNTKAAKSKFAVAGRSAKGDNNIITIDGSGSTIYVDDDQNGKAAKSKFAVAGRSAKGDNLLTVDNAGATVYVDDNASTKAAKSKFAVAGRSAKGDKNIIAIDGSGSTIYVENDDNKNADKKTKAAKSRFAVAGRSAKKSENLFTIDGDGSTVYVDFNADTDKAAKSRFAVAGRSAKGAEDALTIDGDQATFFIDETDEGKAAKSRFAVAGRGAKDVQTAFVVDGSGTLIYIDEWDDSKAAKSTFAVAGRSVGKGGNNYFTISQDSTRIYINDEPVVDTATGAVTTPTLASAFAIVGMTKKTDMLVVNRDSTIVKMNTYVEEQVQSTTGVVEKVVDDSKADKVYTTGQFLVSYAKGDIYGNEIVKYTYYRNEDGNEYLYLIDNFDQANYEYRNYWLVDGKIYRDTTYVNNTQDGSVNPIYSYKDHFNFRYDYSWQEYWETEPFVTEGSSNGGLLTILESKIRENGYKVSNEDGINRYYKLINNEQKYVAETERNTVTALIDVELFKNNLTTFKQLIEPSVAIMGMGLSLNDVESIEWEWEEPKKGYTLLDSCITAENIVDIEYEKELYKVYNEEGTPVYDDQENPLKLTTEAEIFKCKDELRKYTLEQIEEMFNGLKSGFVVTVSPTEGGIVTGLDGGNDTYTYGSTVTLTAVPQEGFIFLGWNDGSSENPRTFTVMGHTTVWANFQSLSDYELVDLGLTTKWAKCNLGAQNENLAGGYYAWGETGTKSNYSNYTYTVNSPSNFRDAATTILGNDYRMPTTEDWQALRDSCNWEYYADGNYFKVSSQKEGNENFIILPITGYYDNGYQAPDEDENFPTSNYWSRSFEDHWGSIYAGRLYFGFDLTESQENINMQYCDYPYAGFQIRPVANTYNVTLIADGNGTVSGGGTFTAGETITITATPNDGYSFVRWSDGNSDNPRLLTVTEHTKLEAIFANVLYVSQANPDLEIHDGSSEYPYSTIADAVNTMESGKNYEIRVIGTIEGPQVISDCDAKLISLTGYGENATLDGKGSAENQVTTLTISTGIPVIIKNLTITGGYASGFDKGAAIMMSGNVTIGEGTVVTGNTATNYASIVDVYSTSSAQLHMEGGKITGNTAISENAYRGVYLHGGNQYNRVTLCLSGNPVVEDVYPARVNNWSGDNYVSLEGNLKDGASINITPNSYYLSEDSPTVLVYSTGDVSIADNKEYFTVTPNTEDDFDWTINDNGELSYYCILTFTVDGKVTETRKVTYGSKTKAPDMPQNPNSNEYVFGGWYYENYDVEENLFVEFDFKNEEVKQGTMDLQPRWLKLSKQLVVDTSKKYIDAEGTDNKPFNHIQNAIDAIKLFNQPNWEYTITVNGMDSRKVNIDDLPAKSVTLQGANEGTNGIDGGVDADSYKDEPSLSINCEANVTLQNFTIKPTQYVSGPWGALEVGDNSEVILNNVTIDGDELEYTGYYYGAVYVKGNLTMNNSNVANWNVCGVYIDGGEFEMNGISHISYCQGGVVVSNGAFTMKNGSIDNNDGTGVLVDADYDYETHGEFTMEAGSIYSNTIGVEINCSIYDYYAYSGLFDMKGGSIYNNNDHGVVVGAQTYYDYSAVCGVFKMSGAAVVDETNDVYLKNDTYLENTAQAKIIVGQLDGYEEGFKVARITPQDYNSTEKVIEENTYDWNMFAVTPNEGKRYIIDNNGMLMATGAMYGKFTVNDEGKQVYFSQGNLQYQANDGDGVSTWRFAENQYDYVGDAENGNVYVDGVKSNNASVANDYTGWIDLFGWGTSGYNGKDPYMTSETSSDYGDGENNIAETNYDWGVYNAISNGGNQANLWRTLTKDEWAYLIDNRTDAASKKGVATVNNVAGLILLPDNWTLPDGVTFTSGANGNFAQNTYYADDWAKMEANGAVFLPAAGYRTGDVLDDVGSYGSFWSSSTNDDSSYADHLSFTNEKVEMKNNGYREFGRSVRLVQKVEP